MKNYNVKFFAIQFKKILTKSINFGVLRGKNLKVFQKVKFLEICDLMI